MNHGVSCGLHLLSDKRWNIRALLTNPKVIQDFDELVMSGEINLNQDGWDPSPIRGLDTFLSESFSAEECQATFSISALSSSSWALNDIPWFRFQQLIKTTGSYSHLWTSEVYWRLTTNSWKQGLWVTTSEWTKAFTHPRWIQTCIRPPWISPMAIWNWMRDVDFSKFYFAHRSAQSTRRFYQNSHPNYKSWSLKALMGKYGASCSNSFTPQIILLGTSWRSSRHIFYRTTHLTKSERMNSWNVPLKKGPKNSSDHCLQ